MANNNLSKSKQKEIKDLIEKGREQGFLTIAEINDLLPTNLYDADQIDGIIKLITDLKIKVVESNKDVDTEVVIGDEEVSDDDDNEITEQEAVEVLSNLDEGWRIRRSLGSSALSTSDVKSISWKKTTIRRSISINGRLH